MKITNRTTDARETGRCSCQCRAGPDTGRKKYWDAGSPPLVALRSSNADQFNAKSGAAGNQDGRATAFDIEKKTSTHALQQQQIPDFAVRSDDCEADSSLSEQ